jgi:hypothetical protein
MASRITHMQTLKELQEQSRWLLNHASNVTSQFGEDGVIARALEVLPERNHWCVEFGAWDGKKYSNTYNLITAHGYRGVLIETDAVRFRDLQRTHDGQKNILINAAVGFTEKDSLEALLRGHPVPDDVDLLSIDIDGNDYHVWGAIHKLRPKLVVIEFNPTIANPVRFIQQPRLGVTHGSSAAAIIELGRAKGYELICAISCNLIFVDSCYFALFNISDNSLAVMRDDSETPHLFFGYDGHIFLHGDTALRWNPRVTLRESRIQALPQRLQKYPDNYTGFERWLFKWWLRLRWGGINS